MTLGTPLVRFGRRAGPASAETESSALAIRPLRLELIGRNGAVRHSPCTQRVPDAMDLEWGIRVVRFPGEQCADVACLVTSLLCQDCGCCEDC
jgi:hypothetical protein